MAATTLSDIRLSPDALMAALDEALDGVFIVNRKRKIVFFNKACERMTGYSRQDMLGDEASCQQLLQCQDEYGRSLGGKLCPGAQLMEGNLTSTRHRVLLKRKDGRRIWVEAVYAPIKDPSGQVELVLGVMRDINQVKRREDEIRQSAEAIRKQLQQYQAEMVQKYGFEQVVASSEAMQQALEKARAACQCELPVLIAGEPGTGKTTLAKIIHYHSARQAQPFVIGSCSAVESSALEQTLFGSASPTRGAPTGWIQAATGGTLYLQDVDALPTAMQVALAQAVQNQAITPADSTEAKPVDFRLIASTKHNAELALADGHLRPELFYVINVINIEVPALRERTEDIPLLVQHFIDRCNRLGNRQVEHIAPRAWSLLLAYDWPGNVRELQHAVESAYALGKGDTLLADDLPATIRGEELALPGIDETIPATSLDEILEHTERRAILAALRRARGRRNVAAKLMGISRSRLYRRMEALGVVPPKNRQ